MSPLLPPLAMSRSSTARSDAIVTYPTSPLGVFPPPAPSVRRSLRDRCGVDLTLQIDSPWQPSKVPGPWSPKGHLQPHRSHLPRRRNPKPRFSSFYDTHVEAPKPASPPAPTPPAVNTLPTPLRPPRAEEPHLQAIIPAVWVAFGREDADRSYEEGFTHVVEVGYSTGEEEAVSRSDGRAQRMRLALPERARNWSAAGRAALALDDAQLRAARDFMAEALPPGLAAMPEEQGDVRVLITTPPGRPTDAMCVLGCYLAFVAGRDAESILQCIDEEEEAILSVWKGEVSGEELERIERVARG